MCSYAAEISSTTLTAVFSDVHGNLEALEAVLRDARAQGAGRGAWPGGGGWMSTPPGWRADAPGWSW